MEEELIDYYEYMLSDRKTVGSIVQYRNALSRLCRYLVSKGKTNWSEVTSSDLANYKVYLSRQSGYPRLSQIKESTQIQHWACIRAFFKYLNEIKGIKGNPANIVFNDLVPKGDPTRDYLTSEELNELWNYCKSDTLLLAILSTLYSTGLRHSEILSLNLGDVDFNFKQINLRKGKGGKPRTVLLTDECNEYLKSYLGDRSVTTADIYGIPLFTSDDGERLNYNKLSYMFSKLKKVIPRIHPHLLRHTFATFLLETGSTIKEVQEQLGHKRIETTSRYVHVVTTEMRRKHGKLPNIRPSSGG